MLIFCPWYSMSLSETIISNNLVIFGQSCPMFQSRHESVLLYVIKCRFVLTILSGKSLYAGIENVLFLSHEYYFLVRRITLVRMKKNNWVMYLLVVLLMFCEKSLQLTILVKDNIRDKIKQCGCCLELFILAKVSLITIIYLFVA
jgi:hypothetical protein